ncbi:MAG: hypothetical protein HQL34_09045 [Alphaproteobacteria bacterium]|nr:hypothetical protein [Alphaproteobacteria bacterium]
MARRVEMEGVMVPSPPKKSRKTELPAVNAEAIDAQGAEPTQTEQTSPAASASRVEQGADVMNAETVTESPAAVVEDVPKVGGDIAADVKQIRQMFDSQMNWLFGATAAAGLALVVALTSPMWSANMGANTVQASRTMALASAYLGRLAESSRPFRSELALVRLSLPSDGQVTAIVDAIDPLAGAGVPTMEELSAKIGSMASDVFMGKMVKNDSTWINSSVSRIASITRIESLATAVAPEYSGEEVALVHEAEAMMAQGDLGQAIDKVGKLTGHAADTAAPWLDAAKQRLLLDEKIAELSALARARASEPARLFAF